MSIEPDFERLPNDDLDALLRMWHDDNAERAQAGRAQVMARLHGDPAAATMTSPSLQRGHQGVSGAHVLPLSRRFVTGLARSTRSGSFRAAASFALLITLASLLIPLTSNRALARQEIILVPDGGKLEARDARGQIIGPCALKHTDVHADIAGPFSRITVKQRYANPYDRKIEAVYTFPLSHRAAVDRLTMTVGERIIEGEVRERQQARQMYESARQAGHVASLLEQERPNIFTQSVANIEPNAEVLIEISYIEMLQQREGEYTFDFPMVVAPRYIPGRSLGSLAHAARAAAAALPNELERREGGGGLILLGPANFQRQKMEMQGEIAQGNVNFHKSPLGPAPYLQRIIDAATPILPPNDGAYRQREDVQALYRANPSYDFDVLYADGLIEFGQMAGDGLGHIAGRWFYFDPSILSVIQREVASDAAAFASDTNQVPDASRITPMPVRPPTRAGHDISLTVRIDTGTGGPAIIDYKSDLHEIICTDPPAYKNLGNRVNLALKNQSEIPNRDFVLRWRCIDDSVREAVFTHADAKWIDAGDDKGGGDGGGGGFFTAVIAPPAKVAPEAILPRELIFVLDTSGSMQGLPIEKAKAVMAKAIDAMRQGDTFNLITFSGDTRILWKAPRPNTETNRAEAQAFLAAQAGNGGTEMMTAINAALTQTPVDDLKAQAVTPADLANMPADGREVVVRTRFDDIEAEVRKSAVMQPVLRVRPDLALKTTSFHFPVEQMAGNPMVELRGKWSTLNGERIMEVATATRVDEANTNIDPLRIVMFLTDGQVGNDDAIISAVRENAKTTRVFSFGIGDSPNRYLLDGIAQAGRGEATYVNLNNDPDSAVQAFARRIEAPVLRDIQVTFSEGLEVFDLMPALDAIPDLWDVKPLIVHGRYSCDKPRNGKITITGKTVAGDYTRVIDIALPAREEGHAMLPALWARARIDDVLARDESIRRQGVVEYATDESKKQVIALGERYGITSAFTSFVAIEKARITIAGQPMLVPIPIEFPSGMNWEGVFGGDATHRPADDLTRQLLGKAAQLEHEHAVQLLALDEARRDVRTQVEVAEQAQIALAQELERVASAQRLASAAEHVRRVGIDAATKEARQLQMELKYDDAVRVIDGILAVDSANPSALALRDIITTTNMYRDYMEAQKVKELGMGQLDVDGSLRDPVVMGNFEQIIELKHANAESVAKELNALLTEQRSGSGSVAGLVEYPSDWPQLSARRAFSATAPRFDNAPQLDLDRALDPGALHYRFADQNGGVAASDGFTPIAAGGLGAIATPERVDLTNITSRYGLNPSDAYFMQVQRQLGEIDPASVTRLGLGNVNSIDHSQLSLRVPAGQRTPSTEGAWNAGVEFAWQGTFNPPPPPPPPSPAGGNGGGFGGGGGGGGGGSGSGGSIFGEAGEDSQRIEVNAYRRLDETRKQMQQAGRFSKDSEPTVRVAALDQALKQAHEFVTNDNLDAAAGVLDEALFIDAHNAEALALHAQVEAGRVRESLVYIVQDNINSDAWRDNGGALAEVTLNNDVLTFRALDGSPDAQQTVDRARGFVSLLAATIPGMAEIAKIDAPPSKPFDPVIDLTPLPPGAQSVEQAGIENAAPPSVELLIYDVRDLIKVAGAGEDESVDMIVNLIEEIVAPEDWADLGGDIGRMQALKGNLIITNTRPNQRAIAQLLWMVRNVIATRAQAPAVAATGPTEPAQLLIGRPELGRVLRLYDAHDLVQAGILQQLIDLITETIEPDGWDVNGGDQGTIRTFEDLLVIVHQPATHAQVTELLQRLRGPVQPPPPQPADLKPQPTPEQQAATQEQAQRKAEATIAALQRADRLRRVIDERLWPLTIHAPQDAPAAAASIVILLKDVRDQAAIDRLKSLGMRIDDTNAGLNLVAGEIADARKLVDVALLDFVRRIEPIATGK